MQGVFTAQWHTPIPAVWSTGWHRLFDCPEQIPPDAEHHLVFEKQILQNFWLTIVTANEKKQSFVIVDNDDLRSCWKNTNYKSRKEKEKKFF